MVRGLTLADELDDGAALAALVGFDHVDVLVGVDPDAVAGAVGQGAPLGQAFAFQGENANQAAVVLGDVDDVVLVNVDDRRTDELAGPVDQMLSLLVKDLDPVVFAVGDEEAAFTVDPAAVGEG